ncbi:hypothetical protein NEOLEDRAFT_704992 [Neolentinus lepideus HHB14362 ss-1]|uniref:Uncharacterized protein n=1 Tax=Neolentinus lepideus HHB14362 ss-1 TaxID=1314782 RepID=A0A165V5I6_9AGAM|nr:hypothetical protein NEOLEDRAFT_704992 [Neolentinus lepideus HHB14362 ss-1]
MVQAPVDTLCTTADVEELDVLEGLSPLFPELDESIGRTLVQTATDLGEGEVHDAHDPDTSGLSPANPIVLTDVEGNIAEKVTLSIVSESKGNDRAIEEAVAEKEDVREQEEKLKKMKTPSVNGRYQAYEASQSASKPLISGLMFDFGSGPWPFAEPGEVITTTPASSTPTRGSANLLGSPLQLQSPTTFNVYRRQKDPFVTPTLPPPPDNWCQPPGYNRDNTLVSISVESTPIRESHPDAPYNESITLADNVSSDSPPKPARWKGKERAVEDRCNLSSLSHARQRTSSARGSPRYEPYRPSAPTPDAADRRYSRHSRRYSDERSVGTLSTRQSPNMRRSVEQSPSNSVSPSLARSRLSSPALMRPAPPTLSRMKVKDRTHWVPAFTRRVSEIRSPGPCTRSSGKRVSRTSGRPPPVPSRSALIQNEDRRSQSSSIGAIRGNRGIPSSPSSLGSMAEISLHSSPPPRPSAPSPASDVSQVRRPHLQPMYSLSSPSEPPESPIALPQRPSGLCPGSASSSPNRRYLPALLPSCSPRTVTDADPSSPNSFGRIPSPVVPMKRPSVPSPGSVSSGSSSWYLPTLLPSCSPSSRTDPDLLSPSNSSQLSTPPTGEIRWQLSPELTQQEPTSPVEPPARPSTPVPGAIPSPDSRPTSLMLRPESVYSIDDQLFFRYDAMRRPDKAWAIDTYRYAFRLERAARGERVLPDYGKDTLHKLDGRITNQSARVRAELKRQEFMDHEDGRRAVRRLTRTMGAFGLSEGDGRPEEWGRVAQEDEEEPDWDEFSIDSGASSSACQESVGFPESGVCFLRPKNAEEESDPRLVEAFNAALEWGLKSYDPEWDPPQHPNRRIREDMYRFWRRKLQDLVENPVEHAFEGTPTLPP